MYRHLTCPEKWMHVSDKRIDTSWNPIVPNEPACDRPVNIATIELKLIRSLHHLTRPL